MTAHMQTVIGSRVAAVERVWRETTDALDAATASLVAAFADAAHDGTPEAVLGHARAEVGDAFADDVHERLLADGWSQAEDGWIHADDLRSDEWQGDARRALDRDRRAA